MVSVGRLLGGSCDLERLRSYLPCSGVTSHDAHGYLTDNNPTHRLLSSSFLGLPYRILNMNHTKELLKSLWVATKSHDPSSNVDRRL